MKSGSQLILLCTLFVVLLSAVASESHLSKFSKKHGDKKHHTAEGGETWRRLHRSNKHGKERLHHLGHDTETSKHIKSVQKHAPRTVSHHEAHIQSDVKASKQQKYHQDWHRQDLHLQDLTHPHNQGHHGVHGHSHEKSTTKHQIQKKTHDKTHKQLKLHQPHATQGHLRSGHQIHKPVIHHSSHDELKEHNIRLHTNSRARAALRLANQHKRADKEKPRKFKKASEKKKYSKPSPHYLW